jgi:hypothetical protein
MTCRTCTTRSPSAAFALACALLAGCSGGSSGGSSTAAQSEQRQPGEFHQVDLRGAGELIVRVGPATSLTLTGDPERLKDVKTEVRAGRLVIDQERGWNWFRGGKLKIELTTPTLDGLAIRGAGDAQVSGIKGSQLLLEIDGAGDLRASGETDMLEAHIKGAGDMDLAQLAARDAKVSINGAGDLSVRASGALEATINGAGSIRYTGHPQPVKSRINGAGSIKPAD